MARRTFHTDTPLQALLVEQALLLARQLERAANDAPDGQVLAAVEATAVPAARELARQAVEATLQAQAPAAEKRGRRPAPVPSVATPAVNPLTPGRRSSCGSRPARARRGGRCSRTERGER
jgi:hypothetical protein